MKKIIILFLAVSISFAVNAQQFLKKIDHNKTYEYTGDAAKDTVIKNQSKSFDYFSPTLFNTFQAQVTVANVSGTTAVRVYVYQSFDYTNWAYVDSSASLSAAGTALTAKCTTFAPFVRVTVKGITNVQKTKVTKVITAAKIEQ